MLRLGSGFLWCFFFFKQKTAYEMRISDWSSDVCSSDLALGHRIALMPGQHRHAAQRLELRVRELPVDGIAYQRGKQLHDAAGFAQARRSVVTRPARKSVVSGKSVSVRVDLGGRRILKKTIIT